MNMLKLEEKCSRPKHDQKHWSSPKMLKASNNINTNALYTSILGSAIVADEAANGEAGRAVVHVAFHQIAPRDRHVVYDPEIRSKVKRSRSVRLI